MRMGGRVAAAIESLGDIFTRHRPAAEALKDWGRANRFAGSGDRHAIGTLVYDALRRKHSLGHAIGSDTPRALALAALAKSWRKSFDEIDAWAAEQHGFTPLSAAEKIALAETRDAPPWIAGDYPEWLQPSFARVFGDKAAAEGAALSERAPVDLRVNTLKTDRPALLAALAKFGAAEGPLSPWSVRIPAPGPDARNANVEAEPAHGMGWFEVQDSASQVAALLSDVKPGEHVADICAGAGGKSLALAAMMENQGKLRAYDNDKFRLRPIFERIARAGAANIDVIGADERARLDALAGGFDCVFVDAPCTGSGAWRRKPDAKWRLTAKILAQRLKDQRDVLAGAAKLVKPGGRIVYVTCSVLQEENRDTIRWFMGRHDGYTLQPVRLRGATMETVSLTPLRHGTDGFFVAVLRKN